MKKILLITLLLSVGFCQQEWNIEFMKEYGGVTYAPNSKKPYIGKVYSFYDSGESKEEGKYRNGLKDGKWTQWHSNGQKSDEGTYKNGKKDGLWTQWHSNGQKSDEGTYKNGKKDGLWTEWHFTGSIYSEKTYRDGELIDEK
jgi:antitoxin component YwqK of YwqJK toxin-antitoxin module